jgi:hypothetical protein
MSSLDDGWLAICARLQLMASLAITVYSLVGWLSLAFTGCPLLSTATRSHEWLSLALNYLSTTTDSNWLSCLNSPPYISSAQTTHKTPLSAVLLFLLQVMARLFIEPFPHNRQHLSSLVTICNTHNKKMSCTSDSRDPDK